MSNLTGRRTVGKVSTPRTPGQRAGLTREAVLTATRDLVAQEGYARLTMRALARRLGVAPNAIYSHVPDRTALLDALLDDVLAAVETPARDAGPLDGLRTVMTSTYEVLGQHRDLVPLYLERSGARGPNARRLGEVMTALLADGGVRGATADTAVRALIVHTIGVAAFAPAAGDERPLDADEARTSFRAGLDWLLTGIFATA